MFLKLILRFFVCITIVTLIGSLGYALRTAILDYEPIKVSLNGDFSEKQKLKIYYSNETLDSYTDEFMNEIVVVPGNNKVSFILDNIKEVNSIKLFLNKKNETFNISNLILDGKEQVLVNKNYLKQLNNLEIISQTENSMNLKSLNSSTPSFIEYQFNQPIKSKCSILGVPINIYVISIVLFLFFCGFWWLMSVISLINKDIAESVSKKNQF